ncbi:DUF3566 domain-containing protein [Pelagicoccus mobilis]|uniref:DUF3566 domain-containing protein n=1 Tax=Pelagicoccus mobilis TaxID=415221 RepID=A0A934VQN7_9BACT|nr:DUF3566 domain-containing protein [Pelagicoccus mobilis]MBK1877100.1 DUF3566 domain-containing protein [Pelagicoccus mobilis]
MTKRLKRINPLQLGKILAAFYALASLIFVPFMLLFSLLASVVQQSEGTAAQMPILLGMGAGFLIIAPIMYGVMGFVAGIIGAFLYNLIAKWLGGIEVEVE